MNFHGQMMNLQPPAGFDHDTTPNERVGYARGHRDARHAAAEVALKADSVRDAAAGLLAHLEAVNCWTREEEPYMDALREALTPNVEFSGVPAGHSSNHPAGGTSAGTQG